MAGAKHFHSEQIVHFDMLDAQGILHNAAYLTLLERARTDFWQANGIRFGDPSFDWPYYVVRHELTYRAPIAEIGPVTISMVVAALGRTSVTYTHEIFLPDGTIAAECRTVIVRVDGETRRPTPWSDRFRAILAPYLVDSRE